jgi:hypothetical protein
VVTYPDAGHNSATRCGFATDWRLPTLRELQGIVWYDDSATIDSNYFPGISGGFYWTSESHAWISISAWIVGFDLGTLYGSAKTNSYYVRLVRSGQ